MITTSRNVGSKFSPALVSQPFSSLKVLDDQNCKNNGIDLKTNIGGNPCTTASFALADSAVTLYYEHLLFDLVK
jgi:hypothetical protein